MNAIRLHNRRAVQIENNLLRVTVTSEGGHVAEILAKHSGVNPLWVPPWPSIEPSSYDRLKHPEYGGGNESQLLSGILGHNICLDTFGDPSPEETAAGIPIHGEAPVAPYEVSGGPDWIRIETVLSKAQLRFSRRVSLQPDSVVVRFSEQLENLSPTDRPIAWTQHVTVGPPFLEPGLTQFRISATHSKVIGPNFNDGKGDQQPDAEFEWPHCPTRDGRTTDLRIFTAEPVSAGFTAHLMDPKQRHGSFLAWSPTTKALFGYIWHRADFPWLARWEENHLRTQPPWNGQGLTCGLEFGVSPMVESRREMVNRSKLFGVPAFRWAPAQTCLHVEYCAFLTEASSIPDSVVWDENWGVSKFRRSSL